MSAGLLRMAGVRVLIQSPIADSKKVQLALAEVCGAPENRMLLSPSALALVSAIARSATLLCWIARCCFTSVSI